MSEGDHISLQAFTGALEHCLGQTFAEPVRLEAVEETLSLPPAVTAGYQFCRTRIKNRPCLLMAARERTQAPAELALHVSLVRAAVDAVVIFVAPSLNAKQCLALMAEGVSFAVPEHVPHIPELGSDLRTYGNAPIPRETDDLRIRDEAWVFPFLPHSA